VTERLRFLVTLAVLAVAGFAGMTALRSRGEDDGSGAKQDVIKRVMASDAPIESGKLQFEVKARLNGVPQLAAPVVVAGSGAFQTYDKKGRQPDFDFTARVNAPAFNEELGARMAKGALYLMQDGSFYTVAKAGEISALMGRDEDAKVDNSKILSDLRYEGEETLDGVKTDHVSAQLALGPYIEEIERQSDGGQLPAEVRTLIDEAVTDSKFEVWAGQRDQKIRRIAFHLGFKTPDAFQQQAQGMTGGDLDIEVSLTEVGKRQRISPPRDPRSLGDLNSQLGQIFSAGMLGGVTKGGASDASERRPAQPAKKADPSDYNAETREYLACVSKATQPEGLQKCIAELR
jgi:hypothetical protein